MPPDRPGLAGPGTCPTAPAPRGRTGEAAASRVCVVGGANSVGPAAPNVARYAKRVAMVVRGRRLEDTMSPKLVEQVHAKDDIEVQLGLFGGGSPRGRPPGRDHAFRRRVATGGAEQLAFRLLEAIAGELNQVWTNLITNAVDTNAVDAMAGTGTLRLSTRPERNGVVVEIGDTGTWESPHAKDHAFEPFFTTKGVGQGTGLGLDISRRIIVGRHRGEITIDVQPRETVLRVWLPKEHGSA